MDLEKPCLNQCKYEVKNIIEAVIAFNMHVGERKNNEKTEKERHSASPHHPESCHAKTFIHVFGMTAVRCEVLEFILLAG